MSSSRFGGPTADIESPEQGVGDDTDDAERARWALVEEILGRLGQLDITLPATVQAALRTVPRHLFTPGVPVSEAYSTEAVVTKRDTHGVGMSSVSAPAIIAMMLAQLDVQPGQRVLEVGSGGYNAALLRELVGSNGAVTTVDIDPDVAGRAEACLTAAGYSDVRVVCADGAHGVEEYGPYDRIIVTVGAWEVAPAWISQLVEGGRLVLPLRTFGLTRSWTLHREDEQMVGSDALMCGFVPIQGSGANGGLRRRAHQGGVRLWVDDEQLTQPPDLDLLLEQLRSPVWSGVRAARGEPFDTQDLWLAGHLAAFGVLTADETTVSEGVIAPSWALSTPATFTNAGFAYRARPRPVDEHRQVFEFGAYGHGTGGEHLAQLICDQIAAWDAAGRPTPQITVQPRDPNDLAPSAPDDKRIVLPKRSTTIVLCWPEATEPRKPINAPGREPAE